jgi:hypothetical protein
MFLSNSQQISEFVSGPIELLSSFGCFDKLQQDFGTPDVSRDPHQSSPLFKNFQSIQIVMELRHEKIFAVGSPHSLHYRPALFLSTEAPPEHLDGNGTRAFVLFQVNHIVVPLVKTTTKIFHQIDCSHLLPFVYSFEKLRPRHLCVLVHVLPVRSREISPKSGLDLPRSLDVSSKSAIHK